MISIFIFLGLLADTDLVLSMAYFGCLGFCMKYVKGYIRRKKEEYGGWPLAYAYNKTRFDIVVVLKFADVVWGIVGWLILGSLLGRKLNEMNHELRATVSVIGITLLFTDIWTPILFRSVSWLVKEHRKLERAEALENDDSDDSELDDFGVRTPLTSPVGKGGDVSGKKIKSPRRKYSHRVESSDEEDAIEDEEESTSPAKALFGKSPTKALSPMHKKSSRSNTDQDFDDIDIELQDPVMVDVVEVSKSSMIISL